MPDPARHAKLVAEGRCVDCAKPRGESPAATRCAPCAQKHHTAQVNLRRKKRQGKPWVDLTNGGPLPVGNGAPPVHAIAHLRIPLTTAALEGITILKKRERERCLRAGERYIGYQVSRLIREAIQTFATHDFPIPVRAFNSEIAVNFHADAQTLAIIDYHARRRFDGNRAATVRAMLTTFSAPTITPTVVWKNRETDEEPSLLDDPEYHWDKRQQSRRDAAHGEAQRQEIEREAKENRIMRRKNYWEFSPSYQQNKAKGERKIENNK